VGIENNMLGWLVGQLVCWSVGSLINRFVGAAP